MHLLAALLFFLFFVFFFIVLGALGIIRSLFSRRPNKPTNHNQSTTTPPKRTKHFRPDQGEYVDFEEVDKDNS